MTTHKQVRSTEEALTLALDALEDALNKPMWNRTKMEKSISAIKAALEAHKALAQPAVAEQHKQEPVQCWKCGDMDAEFQAKCDVPSCGMKEPEQEPVAWLFRDGTWTSIKAMADDHPPTTPVYTTPPTQQSCSQRTAAEGEDTRRAWVGLTPKEELDAESVQIHGIEAVIKWVEAKLKAKNERKEKNTRNGGCL